MAAFRVGTFPGLRQRITSLLAGDRRTKAEEAEALAELRQHREAFAKPLVFRQRDDNADLTALARHVALEHPRLANDLLICLVDDVSRSLRLHQQDCCALVEHTLDLTQDVREVPRVAARTFYNECHHLVLCIHDMAQRLTSTPPDRCSIAFFAAIGGQTFPKALFNALGTVLTDLTGGQASDEACIAHAGAMIPLLVETLLSFSFAFKVTAEDAELTLSLLPHVVMPGHAPTGQGFTISDLDLILREEHADIGITLCLALICMCQPSPEKLDISKVPDTAQPVDVRVDELKSGDGPSILAASQLGNRMREAPSTDNTGYWNEESQLGQFLSFAISGVLLEEDRALRNGYVHWHIFHFIQQEILLSPSISAGTNRSSLLVFMCLHKLLSSALLPVGRRWVAIKKLEPQAVAYRLLAADSLQIAVLRTLNRLCRAYPPACDTFRDVALHCTDTFHLSLPQVAITDPTVAQAGAQWRLHDGTWGSPVAYPASNRQFWIGGAPPTPAGVSGTQLSASSYYDNTLLYAEILDLLATTCARGPSASARHVCHKLVSHSNQWFNWGFIVETLALATRVPSLWAGAGGAMSTSANEARGRNAPAVLVAVCHLISGICSVRLCLSQPPMMLSAQALQAVVPPGASPVGTLGTLLLQLLTSHSDPLVKAASIAALARLDWEVSEARAAFASLVSAVPAVLPGLSDVRSSGDMTLAVEFLACAVHLAQSVPLRCGRHGLDLQAITHVVVHYIILKLLADNTPSSSSPRYWRLACLALRWCRLVLRGPISLAGMAFTSGIVAETYADSEATAAELLDRSRISSATDFMFRSLLALDSPVFARILYLVLLQGHGILGLSERRQGNSAQAFMQQTVTVGLDVLRILMQRDILFLRLRAAPGVDVMAGQATPVEGSSLMPCHVLLFSEFRFPYPPPEQENTSALLADNPFVNRRVWHSTTFSQQGVATAGGRTNPSYLMLLCELVGVSTAPSLSKLALYILAQCAVRSPQQVHAMLQLEPWRLKFLSADLYDCLLRPDEESAAAVLAQQPSGEWTADTEEVFTFEAAEMDAPADAARRPLPHFDVASFLTCLPCCLGSDLAQQLADDALVEMADLVVWAQTLSKQGASADVSFFEAAHFRGASLPMEWLMPSHLPDTPAQQLQVDVGPPPPAPLATMTCRLVALRAFMMLLTGGGNNRTAVGTNVAGEKLCQVILGFGPEDAASMELDVARLGQSSPPVAAIMELLDNPPDLPAQPSSRPQSLPEGSRPPSRTESWLASMGSAVEEHAVFELALGVLLGLLASPASRNAALIQMWQQWPSRYQVLFKWLSVQWVSVPLPMRHTLLSECSLLLRAMSWEMRLVQPVGLLRVLATSGVTTAPIKQQLITKRAVAELLTESVSGFVFSPDDSSLPAPGQEPFLIGTLRQLLEACEPLEAQQNSAAMDAFLRDVTYLSTCACLAPSDAGVFSRCLDLQDPHLFMRLWRDGATSSPAAVSTAQALWETDRIEVGVTLQSNNDAAASASLGRSALKAFADFVASIMHHFLHSGDPVGRSVATDPRAQAMRAHLEALMPFVDPSSKYTSRSPHGLEVVCRLATTFIIVMQKTEFPAPMAFVRSLFWTLQDNKETAAPMAFIHTLFWTLQVAASKADKASLDGERQAQQALLLLMQLVMPSLLEDFDDRQEDPLTSLQEATSSLGFSELVPDELEKLRELVSSLLLSCCALGMAEGDMSNRPLVAGDTLIRALEIARAQHGLGTLPANRKAALVSDVSATAKVRDASMPLLAMLLARVPASQLPSLFSDTGTWLRLVDVLRAVHAPMEAASTDATSQVQLRFATTHVVAALCRSPPLASTLFEFGGLTYMLSPGYLQACRTHLAPPGLPPLDTPHPAMLLAVLEALTAVAGAIPAHRLAMQTIVTWLLNHQRTLLDLVQWVCRLPVGTDSEPRLLSSEGFDALPGRDLGTVLRSAARVKKETTPKGPEKVAEEVLLVLCQSRNMAIVEAAERLVSPAMSGLLSGRYWMGGPEARNLQGMDRDLAAERLVSLALSGRCWMGGPEARSLQGMDRDQVVALCYRCLAAFAELWAALCLAAQRWIEPVTPTSRWHAVAAGGVGPSLQSQILSLEPALEEFLVEALLRKAVVAKPREGGGIAGAMDVDPASDGQLPATQRQVDSDSGLYPEEAVRLRVTTHILHAWRCDSTTQLLQVHCDSLPTMQPGSLYYPMPQGSAEQAALGQLARMAGQARTRVNVLGAVFVRSCSDLLLGLHFAPAPTAALIMKSGEDPLSSPCLQFNRTQGQFRQLLHIIEVSLHLLHVYLRALQQLPYGTQPSPAAITGAPRTAVVVQHLQALRQFASAVGGSVAVAEQVLPQFASTVGDSVAAAGQALPQFASPVGGSVAATDQVNQARPLLAKPLDLTFVMQLAQRVEIFIAGM